jgi:hypothetical protein
MEELSALIQKLPASEQFLTLVWRDVRTLFGQCFDRLKDLNLWEGWDRASFWLESPHKATISDKPMKVDLLSNTVDRYSSYWQKFMCFCFRGMSSGNPAILLTEAQREELGQLQLLYKYQEDTGDWKWGEMKEEEDGCWS